MTNATVIAKIKSIDWDSVHRDLDGQGFAVIKDLLSPGDCQSVIDLYAEEKSFRKTVIMDRHGYGRGEYKYFAYPLPDLVQTLRSEAYPKLAPLANLWMKAMKIDRQYPDSHADFLSICHKAGQAKPTPLILHYTAGDYNCMHQDLYGEHMFPLQLAILLAEPQRDFSGGEFIITEQRPRMQTKPSVVPFTQGNGLIFAVHQRPVKGSRGIYRVNLRHGVSQVHSGERHTLGVIFHDAK